MKIKMIAVLAIAAVAIAAAVFAMSSRTADPSFEDVLLGNTEFLYVSEGTAQPKTISDVPALFDPDDDYMKIWTFAVQDLDRDGNREVLLSVQGISGDTSGSLILHQIGNKVYGYLIRSRELMGLKTDGRFDYTEPATVFETGIGSIDGFTETGYTVDKNTYGRIYTDRPETASNYEDCVVEHQPASEEEFIAAINVHNQKPDAVWYEFTEENVKEIF